MAEEKLLSFTTQQLHIERQLRLMVEEEAVNAQERFEHEQVYQKHVQDKKLSELEKDLCQANLENHQLRLEVHRWRKQHALVKLRLAGAQEDLDLQGGHARQLESRCETLEGQRVSLTMQLEDTKARLEEARAQLDDLATQQAGVQEEAAKLKEDLGNASDDQFRLIEQVRLATMRATAASESSRAMEEALAGARREADAAREQLTDLRRREVDASAAQSRLQLALEQSRSELASMKHQLADCDVARATAEAAAEEAAAAAAAAAERLALKERELADWKVLDGERRERLRSKEEQLEQLTQERIASLKDEANISEARLLDQVAALRRQMQAESNARMAQEDAARKSAADAAASASRVTELERQLAAIQRAGAEREAALAQARAQLAHTEERLRELEEVAGGAADTQRHEQATRAFDVVGQLLRDITPQRPNVRKDVAQRPKQHAKHGGGKGAARGRGRSEVARVEASDHSGDSSSEDDDSWQVEERRVQRAAGTHRSAVAGKATAAKPAPKQEKKTGAAAGKAAAAGKKQQRPAVEEDNKEEDDHSKPEESEEESEEEGEEHEEAPAKGRKAPGGPPAAKSYAAAKPKGSPPQHQRAALRNLQSDANADAVMAGAAARGEPVKTDKVAAAVQEAPRGDHENERQAAMRLGTQVAKPQLYESKAAKEPLAAILQPRAQAAASQRQGVSVSTLLAKLGTNLGAAKPGSRKRKVVPLMPSASDMSQLPTQMLMGPEFTAPRVKRAAG